MERRGGSWSETRERWQRDRRGMEIEAGMNIVMETR